MNSLVQIFSCLLLIFINIFIFIEASKNEMFDTQFPEGNEFPFEMIDLLNTPQRAKREPTIRNSATKFLLEVYNEINEEQEPEEVLHQRHRRSANDEILISHEDRQNIESSHSILTFSSRKAKTPLDNKDVCITFNTNDVPYDLILMHAILRIYKQRSAYEIDSSNLTISIYARRMNKRVNSETGAGAAAAEYRILHSINTTADYRGWLEFNITPTLGNWLHHRRMQKLQNGHELCISVASSSSSSPSSSSSSSSNGNTILNAAEYGIVPAQHMMHNLQPFIIGYFDGPELLVKIQKLRFKRDVNKRKHMTMANGAGGGGGGGGAAAAGTASHMQNTAADNMQLPPSCARLNFTVDFKEVQMDEWVIAPKKFEAYVCGGGCHFPLGPQMNATNHAIVQSLMHLKQPHLPKPCCVPTTLGSVTILRYLNEDIIDLTKYRKIVAKECGCH